jgi:hypothetical protein
MGDAPRSVFWFRKAHLTSLIFLGSKRQCLLPWRFFSAADGTSVCLLTSTNNGYPDEEQEYQFRHTRWGMSQSEVRLAENGEPEPDFSKGPTLVWKGELLGEQAAVVYTFAFNKLVRAKYMLAKYSSALQGTLYRLVSPKKPSAGEFIVDFGRFEKALIEKYGKPDESYQGAPKQAHESIGTDPEAMDNAMAMIEEAIRTGKLAWYSKWKTKDTSILLILHGSPARNRL